MNHYSHSTKNTKLIKQTKEINIMISNSILLKSIDKFRKPPRIPEVVETSSKLHRLLLRCFLPVISCSVLLSPIRNTMRNSFPSFLIHKPPYLVILSCTILATLLIKVMISSSSCSVYESNA